jgi:hypothetical protein
MNHLLAKKGGRNGAYVKIMSDNNIFQLPEDLDNPHVYDNDHKLDDDEWFAITTFSNSEYSIDFINADFNSAEYNQIRNDDYTNLKFLCSYQDDRFYFFQKITRSQTITKKWFKMSNEPVLSEDPIIIIKPYSDAIYDKTQDTLYFKNLTAITSIFPEIGNLYREATDADTEEFLNNVFISLTNNYDVLKVKTANRKRIAMAMDTLGKYTAVEKNQIFEYIKDYCTELAFSEELGHFEIGTEDNLKHLLYGIEQRYFTTPLGNEKRLANSITTLTPSLVLA